MSDDEPSPSDDSRAARRSRPAAVVAALALLVLAACTPSAGEPTTSADRAGAGTRPATGAPSEPQTPTVRTDLATAVATADELYAVPDPLPAADHGTLLRYQEVTPSIAEHGTTYRILYLSTSVRGEPIAVSGTAVVPTAPPPDGGRVLLSIGHGTTGVADECAPSREPDRFELSLMGPVVTKGWLLVQTDYEGLGTPGRHPYLVGESEGRSMLDAARAAAALPDAHTGTRVGLAGYSQGGHAALWADGLAAAWTPELDVTGVFAGAPATEIDAFLQSLPAGRPRDAFGLLVAAGHLAAHPDDDPAAYLTPAGVAHLDAVDRGCLNDLYWQLDGVGPSEALLTGDATGPAWSALAAETDPARAVAPDPVLIVHSAQDEVIPASLSEQLATRLCEQGRTVERRVLADGGTHGGAAFDAYLQGLTWLAAIVDGGPPPISTCAPLNRAPANR